MATALDYAGGHLAQRLQPPARRCQHQHLELVAIRKMAAEDTIRERSLEGLHLAPEASQRERAHVHRAPSG